MNDVERSDPPALGRVRRSLLYLPGSNARAIEKARSLPADMLVLDLEDAVLPVSKLTARRAVCSAVLARGYGLKEVAIRVNGLGTEWHEPDLAAACAVSPDGIVVPKVSSADDVVRLADAMQSLGAPEHTKLWVMLETPLAILNAAQIAAASRRLEGLILGTNDLAHELRATHLPGRASMGLALQMCVLAARAAGKVVVDGVYNDIGDEQGFRAECSQARHLGFDGKTVIHPSQIDACNEVFSPTMGEIEAAREIVTSFENAQTQGRGVVAVNGRMVEQLHVDDARRTLAIAEALELEARYR